MKTPLARLVAVVGLGVTAVAATIAILSSPKTAPATAAASKPVAVSAASAPKPPAAVTATLEVFPTGLKLESRRAARQLVVTARVDGEARDVTHLAQIRSGDDRVAKVDHARVMAAGDGRTSLSISWEGQELQVPVNVTNFADPDPIAFKFETMPLLTTQGCATGSCHGSPVGKAGFTLSLFGYDPTIDRRSLTRDGFSRRVDVMQPEESLLLKKPLLELAHVGGKRLRHGETPFETLLAWISEGANVDLPAVECERIVVTPGPERVLSQPFFTQQLSVLAHYTDGSFRDVTAIARFDTSNSEIATVDPKGLVTGKSRGQAAISVRYLAELQSVYFTVIEEVPGFAWTAAPEFNVVDTLVNAKLRQLKYLPAGTCDDATFVRRVHLDLTGLIPTADDARRFIASTAPDKRAKLVDELLAGEAFARFWALKQADLMRVSKTRLAEGRAEAFSAWLVDAVRRDLPYDEFARKLLTATGDSRKVPEANFFVAIPGPQERTEMTAQLFLGSRLECAKCHNHPYEKWTMRDYYSLSAVFARTAVDQGIVQRAASGETLHPTTNETMKSWGATDATAAEADRRGPFVAWLTQPDNPLFARVEANRIWAHLLGRGIVDPVDDFRSSNPPANVPLLDALAREFVKSGYRRKELIRLICNSQTYQRSMASTPFNESDELLFSHARPRLLTAEQLKDAVGVAARTLAPIQSLPEQIAASRAAMNKRLTELDKDFPAWVERATADVAARDFWMGSWYAVGPFAAKNRDEPGEQEFGPEQFPVNYAASFDEGRRRWRLRTEWNDPEPPYPLDVPKDSTVYLSRQIYSRDARTLQVTARANGMIWCNGKPALTEPLAGERRVQIRLEPGLTHLVMKVASREDDTQFRFSPIDGRGGRGGRGAGRGPGRGPAAPVRMPVLPQAFAVLAKPAAERMPDELAALREDYPQMDEAFLALQQRLAAQQQYMDYATQRPYPEAESFMTAFGQPKRETACSCERSGAPTLLQALELLNGTVMRRAVESGANRYESMENAGIVDELYLSALARFPTDTERKSATAFLAGAPVRREAVMDLLWSVLNTREFLFQH
jgi:hypothetical protein